MPRQSTVLFISEDNERIKDIMKAEPLLEQIKIQCAGSESEGLDLLSSFPDIPVFVFHTSPESGAFDLSKSLSNHFPEITVTIMTYTIINSDQENNISDNSMVLPLPETSIDYALVIQQGVRTHNNQIRAAEQLQSITDEKTSAEETTRSLMKAYQDIANLVHCGQRLQETIDRDEGCEIISDALKDVGLNSTIVFKDKDGVKNEIRQLSNTSGKHFKVFGECARLYFADIKYAGYIDVESADGEAFDENAMSDPLHLIRNQFMAFLDRFGHIEEKEQLLEGYMAILSKLENIIKNADFSKKTQNVRKELENDTEGIFNILDKMREKVPAEVVPWVDEVELSLQFADKVSQQINSLASILRELLGTINPSLAKELEAESNESTQSVLNENEAEGQRKSVDELLESLGV